MKLICRKRNETNLTSYNVLRIARNRRWRHSPAESTALVFTTNWYIFYLYFVYWYVVVYICLVSEANAFFSSFNFDIDLSPSNPMPMYRWTDIFLVTKFSIKNPVFEHMEVNRKILTNISWKYRIVWHSREMQFFSRVNLKKIISLFLRAFLSVQ